MPEKYNQITLSPLSLCLQQWRIDRGDRLNPAHLVALSLRESAICTNRDDLRAAYVELAEMFEAMRATEEAPMTKSRT